MTTITVCITCRTPENREHKEGDPDGEAFFPKVQAAGAAQGVKVRSTACLMGCEHGCNIAIQDEGKLTYVLGEFEGTEDDAEAIAEFAAGHARSTTGQVPFKEWPQGVKGHFVSRVPPLELDAAPKAPVLK